MLAHGTDINRWQWQESVHEDGWHLTVEGKNVSVRELFKNQCLSGCVASKALQSELLLRLKKIVEVFSHVFRAKPDGLDCAVCLIAEEQTEEEPANDHG